MELSIEKQEMAQRILGQLSDISGLPVEEILGKRKRGIWLRLRRVAARILRRRGFSYPELGKALNRDHTSVHNLLKTNPRPTRLFGYSRSLRQPSTLADIRQTLTSLPNR